MMTQDPSQKMSSSTANSKWYLAYFFLAAFDILTISTGLYLTHTIMNLYTNSVEVNREWAFRLAELDKLRELAGSVNAPGNNVFDTQDVVGESQRMAERSKNFSEQLGLIRKDFVAHAHMEPRLDELLSELTHIQTTMELMTDQAALIFSSFLKQDMDGAGKHMANMDREYERVNASFAHLDSSIRDIQQFHFDDQRSQAHAMQRYEFVIAVFIFLMIGMASLYGHRIYTKMKADSLEREDFLRKLQEIDIMKTTFFADISHELRTPITVIRGEAEVTLRGKAKPIDEYKSALERIVRLSDHLQKLVNDLLFLARSESGSLEIDKHQVDVQKILREATNDAQILAKKKGITLEHPRIETSVRIQGDPQRLRQVFFIILDNAVQYTPSGGKIEVHSKKNGRYNHIVITDTGIGIPPENLKQVFDRFYRIPHRNGDKSNGTGLGLPIAKWITEAHHGRISLVSSPGKGTQVKIALPL